MLSSRWTSRRGPATDARNSYYFIRLISESAFVEAHQWAETGINRRSGGERRNSEKGACCFQNKQTTSAQFHKYRRVAMDSGILKNISRCFQVEMHFDDHCPVKSKLRRHSERKFIIMQHQFAVIWRKHACIMIAGDNLICHFSLIAQLHSH